MNNVRQALERAVYCLERRSIEYGHAADASDYIGDEVSSHEDEEKCRADMNAAQIIRTVFELGSNNEGTK